LKKRIKGAGTALTAVIRGGGDLASGVIYRLHSSGFITIVLEAGKPTHIRCAVSFAQAVFDGEIVIEGLRGIRVSDAAAARELAARGDIPVLIDPDGSFIPALAPDILVDAIMAKENRGTRKTMAPVVVAIGPGFEAGADVHAVVETNRGHTLGRVLWKGRAQEDTGIPGSVMGYSSERVLRAAAEGLFKPLKQIGDLVQAGDVVAAAGGREVKAQISGVIRGMLNEGLEVVEGYKVGDIDPRGDALYCSTISDKALAVGGGVLEAVLHLVNR
jgi:xanthine dehydrogenase accessory factor